MVNCCASAGVITTSVGSAWIASFAACFLFPPLQPPKQSSSMAAAGTQMQWLRLYFFMAEIKVFLLALWRQAVQGQSAQPVLRTGHRANLPARFVERAVHRAPLRFRALQSDR